MANAPKFTSGEPTTLVKIDKVYATKQKAETNAATTIHVERGLAKVTVAALPTGKSPTGTNILEIMLILLLGSWMLLTRVPSLSIRLRA